MEENMTTGQCPSCEFETKANEVQCNSCGFQLNGDANPFKEGDVLESRYRIDTEVGRGGMGVVYRGIDLTLSRAVAIKAMLSIRTDAGVLARFMHEARALASVEHPRLVPVYAVGQVGGVYYMVMRFVEGQPLSSTLETKGRMAESHVRRLVGEVCEALEVLNENGLVHRDLKPANLMMGPDDSITVMDLGIVKAKGDSAEVVSTGAAGTPKYMPPEMFSNLPVDGRADLYALGVIAYQCLAGEVPFDGPTPMAILYKQAHTEAEPIRSVRSDVSKEFASIIHRLLRKDPQFRFADAKSLTLALNTHVEKKALGKSLLFLLAVVALVLIGVFVAPGGKTVGSKSTLPRDVSASVAQDTSRKPGEEQGGNRPENQTKKGLSRRFNEGVPSQVLKPDAGIKKLVINSVTIVSTPSGAMVFQGRKRLGPTPYTLQHSSDHEPIRLVLKKRGYKNSRLTARFDRTTTYKRRLSPKFEMLE
jgi:serine/threonine protein kinase